MKTCFGWKSVCVCCLWQFHFWHTAQSYLCADTDYFFTFPELAE